MRTNKKGNKINENSSSTNERDVLKVIEHKRYPLSVSQVTLMSMGVLVPFVFIHLQTMPLTLSTRGSIYYKVINLIKPT
jgi:hypothetical protein